jgi:biotin/methionine sulfoxide reductase
MVTRVSHSSHWGAFEAIVEGDTVVGVEAHAGDRHPSPLLANIPGSTNHKARVTQPFVRRGWLENGPGPTSRLGRDEMVPVGWDEAIALVAAEMQRVIETHGNRSIYGGSYGWSSAGRFHHAQSQLHRFLNVTGGYVSSVNTYSNAAGEVILDRVMGNMREVVFKATAWEVIAAETDLVLSFGGLPLKNTAVSPGGASRHTMPGNLIRAAERGCEFIYFSPLRDDLMSELNGTWYAPIPGSDVAIMLAMAWVLDHDGLVDHSFLTKYTVGYEQFSSYLRGETDGIPKTPAWAEVLSGIPAEVIERVARELVRGRTLINTSWSLQRSQHGEQPPWMALTLAAMVGQIGLPGGGYGFGYGSMASVGEDSHFLGTPLFSQLENPVKDFIPVARVSDLLLNPGQSFDYNGQRLTYPDIRLVWWGGGNPFHHHQDLRRLREALGRPETVIVNDPYWTPMARHADVVLPSTVTLERDDIGGSSSDSLLVAMKQGVAPNGEARNDFRIFADISAAMGNGEAFTEGRCEVEWVRAIYGSWQEKVKRRWPEVPDYAEFRRRGFVELPQPEKPTVMLEAFRADPVARPLGTPSGKIEIFSEAIDSFAYDDCAGHPTWYLPDEWLGSEMTARFPLQLIANNPRTRLHSQLDMGAGSQASKVNGREPMRMHPTDADVRGIESGDVVRLFNDRGACLVGVEISEMVRPSVVQLSTGAWFDPLDPEDTAVLCVHGNPNVLTRDIGTSKLAQGCTGQHTLVEVEKWIGVVPPIRAYEPPS